MKAPVQSGRLQQLFRRVKFWWLFSALTPVTAFAANFYVATDGNDAAAGTLEAPFASIMRAQTAASSGDTVFVRGGTYNTFAIAAIDANYNYVHRLSKGGVTWSAYPGETPVFDFSSVPTNLRVCGFHVTGTNVTIIGFQVTGVKDGAQKQSECFRIDGSAAVADFIDCVAHDNAANGFYFTNHARGSCTRCDSYNNIGTNGESIGNTDGFGAHGNGVTFRYCRAWNNSDDGYDCISSDATGVNVFDHCWAYNMRAGGDSNGFKVGGYGSGAVPATVPAHVVRYCLSANNNAHGFYANHQPGKAADWLHNTAFNQSAGNFDMLERVSPTDATDIPGFREVLHNNVSFQGTIIKDDANPPESVTENSWTKPGVSVAADDFLSLDASQMTAPRSAGNNMPFITFMHLAPGSDLAGLGCFEPPPPAPTNLHAAWVTSGRVDLSWTASPGATQYYVKRATVSGGPYTSVAVRLSGTSFSDTNVGGSTTYYYRVSAMDDVSYDESVSDEAAAILPAVAITGITEDSGASNSDGVTNDSTLVISGTAGVGSSVTVTRVGTGDLGTVIADGNGLWSFDYTGTTLPEGTYTFQVSAPDAASGTTFTSDPFVVTVDTTPPTAPTIDYVGADPLVASGTGAPLGNVTLRLDGSAIASTVAAENGTWWITYGTPIPAGAHEFTAIGSDLAGNLSGVSGVYAFNPAVAAPVITSAQSDSGTVLNGAFTSDPTLSFAGTSTAGDTVSLTRVGSGIIGTTVADGSGHWTIDHTASALPEGPNRFFAIASNASGSSVASAQFLVNVDSVAPAVLAIARQNPLSATVTSAASEVVFRVTFGESVTGVDTSDFALTTTGDAAGTVAAVAMAGESSFDVTVNALSGEGTLRLDLKASGTGIVDVAGNAAPGFAAGESYTRVLFLAGSGTWIQPNSGGGWSAPANWLNAVIPNGSTHSADFSGLDLTATNTVHLDSPRTINSATFGDADPSTSAGWVLDDNGNPANALTLAGSVPTITVNALGANSTTVIGARLAGTGGFTKAGPGTLVLTGANTLTGALITSAGVLRVDPAGSLGSSTIAVNTGARLDLSGGSLTATGTTTITGASNTSLVINSGSAALKLVTFTNASGGLFRVNGGTASVDAVTIPRSSDATVSFASGFLVTGGSTTVGPISLGTSNSNGAMSIEGGSLLANGVITIGNQATGGRGGAMRVTSGSFTSTEANLGIVLSKTNGANANNVSSATFTGGVSTVEKFTLGFDSTVTAGSATITLNGGTLYLGAGGLVKNGTGGFVTNLNFGSGLLGAKAAWSTSLPITLPSGGNIVLKTANANNEPFDITLGGVLSGPGGFTKTGVGTLTLSAAETFTGSVNLNDGTLRITGSLAAGGALNLNGGTLSGGGTINKPVVLNGATIAAGAGNVALSGASLTWNGGGSLGSTLGATGVSGKLVLSGALLKGSAGSYEIALTPSAGFAAGNSYTLATFASTTFSASDFAATGLPAGYVAIFSISGTSLNVTVKQITSVVLGDLRQFYDGEARAPSATTDPAGLTVVFAYTRDGVEVEEPVYPGTYHVVAMIDDAVYTGSASDTFVITTTAVVNHAPSLGGSVDGSVQMLAAENLALSGDLSNDLLVRGTPKLKINGHPLYVDVIDATGDSSPTNYTVTLNGGAALRYLVRHTDPVAIPDVTSLDAPTGTRSVTLTNSSQSPGDFSTLKNLTLNGGAGVRAIPPGTYGNFAANGGSGFILGDANSVVPVTYQFQRLTLNGSATLQLVGPTVVKLGDTLIVNATAGSAAHPRWLTIQVASGGVTLNLGATLYGEVVAPTGTVMIGDSATLNGNSSSDRLSISTGGLLHQVAP